MKQQIGLIILSLALVVAAYLVASGNRYQFIEGEALDRIFDRWTGRVYVR